VCRRSHPSVPRSSKHGHPRVAPRQGLPLALVPPPKTSLVSPSLHPVTFWSYPENGRFTRARRAAARRTRTDEEPHEHDAQTRDGDLVRLRSDGRAERGHPLSLTSAFGGHGGRSDHLATPVGEAHAHQPSTDCSRVTRSTARPRSSGPCLSLGVGGPKHCLDIALVVCTG
jgi:hypothetical protein